MNNFMIQVGGGWIPDGYLRVIANETDIDSLSTNDITRIKKLINEFIERFGTHPLIFKLKQI